MVVRPNTKWILAAIGLAGLFLRLAFVTNGGFHNDVDSFISWANTASTFPLSQFYDRAGFADYPPGYLYVLAVVGHVQQLLHIGDATVLVKLPAILCDLLIGLLLFNLTRRFASENWAVGVAAFYVLNPATILISGLWGQVESVGGTLALLSIFLLIKAQDDEAPAAWYIPAAWLCLSASILMKPEASILLVLFIAYAFAGTGSFSDRLLSARARSTAIGMGASLVLALIVALPFHPTYNPVEALRWLIARYEFGKDVYKASSVNAFNLWSVKLKFWQDDTTPIMGIPMYVWGVCLQLAAIALVAWRYLQEKTSRALLESCALLLLAFFLLNTRMHERYLYDGFLFVIVCASFAARYRIAAIILSITFFANLEYSLFYLKVFDQHLTGWDTSDLWGIWDHLMSSVNVLTFFVLGFIFLGGDAAPVAVGSRTKSNPIATPPVGQSSQGRSWFDPTEGLSSFKPIDYLVSSALGVVSFVLSLGVVRPLVGYWLPNEKIFDEIYFARAGYEYLSHIPVYETTHPPLTKLIIAGSMLLFGGLHGLGNTPWGWRFIDVVCGALVVVLLYAFARRVTGSTIFAAIAASFLMFDGMHFVQSRIATPEGIVIVFSTGAVYAFYRFWIASQVNTRRRETEATTSSALMAGIVSLILGFLLSGLVDGWMFHQSTASVVVIGLYLALGLYLLMRLVVSPSLSSETEIESSFGEGSFAIGVPGGATTLYTADGGELDSSGKPARRGRRSQSRNNTLAYKDDDLEITYARDASVTYATPAGAALYTADAIVSDAGNQRGRHTTFWLLMFTVALGCLVSSKWYGVMGFGVSFLLLILVWLQRYTTRGAVNPKPTLWGNPRGFRLDVALCTIVFVAATVYALVYVPEFVRQLDVATPTQLVYRQYTMFEYHDKLVATHPYSSEWWQWPLDGRPIAYYYKDGRTDKSDPNAGPVSEILSLPNPAILWFGLFSVPFVGVLAWLRRNKGYALIVVTYLMQWLPWMRSPRITFAYHFYVDIPLICLCNAIFLQWAWERFKDRGPEARLIAGIGIGAYVAIVALTFVWFYPILAGVPLAWNAWDARMWHMFMGNHWI